MKNSYRSHRERRAALVFVLVLHHHRGLEVRPVGDERVVRVDLVLDALLLEDLLDAQHLLHLVADGELVLEDERHVLAQVHGAVLLVRDHAGAEFLAGLGVGLERHQGFAGKLLHGGSHSASGSP